jgi:hypothetical protein
VLVIDDVSEEEWEAFQEALAEADPRPADANLR